ncbi:hypothetical protein SCLARK_001802 [Spiroplasma clarkii]|uniref:triphosphoribosyl-dephospho-CoA synthase n=1 Tax=Spiroplasma clarkii TaxID=2139 RepID=A0A1Y0L2M6_9MOLU|nr:triphosphoribosyl-dephospho-CoA synthase [Spiroplasma clarkii]ARU92247.1 hypothetical protein SCLARK_001802 [Spiroplasma clarkii]ATX71566.1 triphosphoribosyl-dephospho-CoA synthase [Spiroplasma clarkii]
MKNKISKQFLKAIKTEFSFYPSLGLVSKKNSGSHQDMNYHTYLKSFKVFKPYFLEIDYNFTQIKSFDDLKTIGYKYEQLMFNLTKNINTHKGLIFCAGIFYYCFKLHQATGQDLQSIIINFCKPLRNMHRPASKSMSQCKIYSLKHAIDYALTGYEIVFEGYKVYKAIAQLDLSTNLKYFTMLIWLTLHLDDSTLINKIGYQEWLKVKQNYEKVFSDLLEQKLTWAQIIKINNEAIRQNISPGGCADILVLILFLDNINYS